MGSLPYRVSLQAEKEIADPCKAALCQNLASNYAAFGIFGFMHTTSLSKEFADQGITSCTTSAVLSPKVSIRTIEEEFKGLKNVTCSKKTTTGRPPVITVKHRWKPHIVVQNPASIPIISKKETFRTIFVSRLSPEVTAYNVEKSLKRRLSLKKLVYLTLKTTSHIYESFHILAIEDEFPLIKTLVFILRSV
jgi:hypothetical protein